MSNQQSRGAVGIGTSGYQYPHWQGVFYPDELPRAHWFEYYTRYFAVTEINNTFYRLPAPEVFDEWRRAAPDGFRYALKYSRYGSHIKRLKDPGDHVGTFMERACHLGPALGPILVQLPPNWRVDAARLQAFLEATPSDQRWAVELRDERWLCDAVFALLEKHNAALVVHDMIDDHPDEATADWAYLRFHGPRGDYRHSYSPQKLTAIARRVRRHRDTGRDVYAFFNNDDKGHAVNNALALRRYVDAE